MISSILKENMMLNLSKVKDELMAFKNETLIWKTIPGVANSAGNLCLHLVGNLNAFIGAPYGHTGYTRQREQEFTQKDLSRTDIIKKLEDTLLVLDKALNIIQDTELSKPYPIPIPLKDANTGTFLFHLATHLTYHLGQINYLRRILEY
jgi:uncharacterized damage-inducible protein DinB